MEKQKTSQPESQSQSQSQAGGQRMGDTAKENIARQQEMKVSNQRTSSGETSTAKDQTENREQEVERSKDRVPDMPN